MNLDEQFEQLRQLVSAVPSPPPVPQERAWHLDRTRDWVALSAIFAGIIFGIPLIVGSLLG